MSSDSAFHSRSKQTTALFNALSCLSGGAVAEPAGLGELLLRLLLRGLGVRLLRLLHALLLKPSGVE